MEKLEELNRDYEKIDDQITRAKTWLQNQFMGLGPEGETELTKDNPYLAWARDLYGDDLNLLACEIFSRERASGEYGGDCPNRILEQSESCV